MSNMKFSCKCCGFRAVENKGSNQMIVNLTREPQASQSALCSTLFKNSHNCFHSTKLQCLPLYMSYYKANPLVLTQHLEHTRYLRITAQHSLSFVIKAPIVPVGWLPFAAQRMSPTVELSLIVIQTRSQYAEFTLPRIRDSIQNELDDT